LVEIIYAKRLIFVSSISSDHVLAAVTWSKPDEVVAVWMNRVQNKMLITAHDHANGNPVTVSTDFNYSIQ
jgi:Dipeptidyl peptidase IV (DPP IV) N-terminal region